MKTRAQIYEREAAALLRDISMYHVMAEEQLLRLHPGKEDKIKNLLSYLVRQGRIWQDHGCYCDTPEGWMGMKQALFDAVWVLSDFIGQVEFHSTGDYPAEIIFFADGEVYEIVYAAQGKEVMLSQILSNSGEQPSRYLVMVEEVKQIAQLQIPNVNGYCIVSPGGTVEYYKSVTGNEEE